MTLRLAIFSIFVSIVHCHDSESTEINKVEFVPLYDTIILRDVMDILNENVQSMNPDSDIGNDSEENIEQLLAEYQHFLDKEHRQIVEYYEKNKNKFPIGKHDRFPKMKQASGMKFEDYYLTDRNPAKIFQNLGPLDYMNKYDSIFGLPKESGTYQEPTPPWPTVFSKSKVYPMKSPCVCKNGMFSCKQCMIPYDLQDTYVRPQKYSSPLDDKAFLPNAEKVETIKPDADDGVNVHIKVDITLPNPKELFTKNHKNRSFEDFAPKEAEVNIPFTYWNYPIPMDLFSLSKPLKSNYHDTPHKMTVHRKKKFKSSSGSKKHKKKLITLHSAHTAPSRIQPYSDASTNNSTDIDKVTEMTLNLTVDTNPNVTFTTTLPEQVSLTSTPVTENKHTEINNHTDHKLDDTIYVTVNLSNSSDNETENQKTYNSVETDFAKIDTKGDAIKMRRKRSSEDPEAAKSVTETTIKVKNPKAAKSVTNTTIKVKNPKAPKSVKKTTIKVKNPKAAKSVTKTTLKVTTSTVTPKVSLLIKNNDAKKSDKVLLTDSELLYWPTASKNLTINANNNIKIPRHNITAMILEREYHKTKLNMSKETIQQHRNAALEKAIFGDVDWDDIDTVAPEFMSFVGKYLKGVLTFCSQNLCHSMKCADKSCVHRVCMPFDRWNKRGHCAGLNATESVASLESIMDLPSNVAFEIVDILQDKMLGKLYGKMTLCINNKCITFVAAKKSFLKSKCTSKQCVLGHCPNVKNLKIM